MLLKIVTFLSEYRCQRVSCVGERVASNILALPLTLIMWSQFSKDRNVLIRSPFHMVGKQRFLLLNCREKIKVSQWHKVPPNQHGRRLCYLPWRHQNMVVVIVFSLETYSHIHLFPIAAHLK